MDKDQVAIDTLLHAPVAEVWKAWTTPDTILQWFGSDPGGSGVKARIDLRVGGHYEISFQNADQTQFTCLGVYAEVQEFQKLAFNWMWENEPGVISQVTVLLAPEGEFTQMHFEHRDLGTASAHDYLPGWQRTFVKLDRMLMANADR